jgi:hypothetical protein
MNGDTLGIALGMEESVLNFISFQEAAILRQQGIPPKSSDGVLRFEYFGSMTEFPEWQGDFGE